MVQRAALRAVLLVVLVEALPPVAELQEPLPVRVPRPLPEQWLEQLLARSPDWA